MYAYEFKQLITLYHFEILNKEPYQIRNKNGRYQHFIHNSL
ncbi:hypothetical protein [Arsukibacterium sp.]